MQLLHDGLSRSSVTVPGEFRPLEQAVLGNELIETVSGMKEITDTLLLSIARRTGRRRDRQPDLRMLGQQSLDQRALANTTGSGDHRETPCAAAHL